MRLHGRLRGVACAVWLSAVGCAGKKHGEASEPLPREKYAAEMAEASCASRAPCCKAEGITYDRATCVENEKASAEAQLETFSLNMTYDADAARTCVNALRSRGCDRVSPLEPYPGCAEVWAPALELGSACASYQECLSGICSTGVCVAGPEPAPAAGEGEPCDRECDVGVDGNYVCYGSGPVAQVEGGCYLDQGLFCQFDYLAGEPYTGTCRRIPSVGEECLTHCEAGATCGPGGGCVKQIDSGECLSTNSICSPSTFCREIALTTDKGMCEPRRADGERCEDADWCQSRACNVKDGERRCGYGSIATPDSCRGL